MLPQRRSRGNGRPPGKTSPFLRPFDDPSASSMSSIGSVSLRAEPEAAPGARERPPRERDALSALRDQADRHRAPRAEPGIPARSPRTGAARGWEGDRLRHLPLTSRLAPLSRFFRSSSTMSIQRPLKEKCGSGTFVSDCFDPGRPLCVSVHCGHFAFASMAQTSNEQQWRKRQTGIHDGTPSSRPFMFATLAPCLRPSKRWQAANPTSPPLR